MGRKFVIPSVKYHTAQEQYYIRLSYIDTKRRQDIYLGRDKSSADKKAEKVIDEYLRNGRLDPGTTNKQQTTQKGISIGEVFNAYAEYKQNELQGQKSEVIKRTNTALNHAYKTGLFSEDTEIGRITEATFHQLREKLPMAMVGRVNKTPSVTNINKQFKYLEPLLTFAKSRGWVSREVLADIRDIPHLKTGDFGCSPAVKREPAELDTVLRFLTGIEDEILWAMIVFGWVTGCRIGEVCNITKAHIEEWEPGFRLYHLTDHKTKGILPDRYTPIPDSLYNLMSCLSKWGKLGPNDYIFTDSSGEKYDTKSFGLLLDKECRRLGIKFTYHQLRHSASTWAEDELDHTYAALLLGHKNKDTTAIYTGPKLKKRLRRLMDVQEEVCLSLLSYLNNQNK